MSRAQGDGYKTWTNKGLNDYRARLDRKLAALREERVKVYHFGNHYIFCTTSHILRNERGDWKWDGWEVVGDSYRVSMYDAEHVRYTGKERFTICGYVVDGLAVRHMYADTEEDADAKDKANDFFRECKAYALA